MAERTLRPLEELEASPAGHRRGLYGGSVRHDPSALEGWDREQVRFEGREVGLVDVSAAHLDLEHARDRRAQARCGAVPEVGRALPQAPQRGHVAGALTTRRDLLVSAVGMAVACAAGVTGCAAALRIAGKLWTQEEQRAALYLIRVQAGRGWRRPPEQLASTCEQHDAEADPVDL